MVAATSADVCLSLEAIGDAEAPDVVGWVADVCAAVEMKEAISCTEPFVVLALFSAETCAVVMPPTWPGVKADA